MSGPSAGGPPARTSRLSLRWRLALVLVGFTTVVLLLQDIPLFAYLRGVESDRIVTGLQRDAFTLAGRSAQALENADRAGDQLAGPVRAYTDRTGAQVSIVAADRTIVVESGDVGVSVEQLGPALAQALAGQSVSGDHVNAAGESLLYVAVPVRSGTDILGAVSLIYPAADVDDAVGSRVRGLVLVGLITIGAAALVAALLSGVVTQRLRRLRHTSGQLAEGDLSARAETGGMAELDDLSRSFNAMAERIEDLVAAQRGFAGDASHQLRTPLTALRLRLEQAAADIDEDPQAARGLLEAAHAEADRLQHLVDGLLVLARAEGSRSSTVPTDLAAIVAERADAWQPLAEERQVEVRAEGGDPSWVWAVPGTVEQIVDNYIDNALEVAPVGSTVLVRVVQGAPVVAVEDSGPGLTDAERARAFDRFWRGGSDRSGSGLGLAIVRSLAAASGAVVALERAADGGVCAEARFRRCTPADLHPSQATVRQ